MAGGLVAGGAASGRWAAERTPRPYFAAVDLRTARRTGARAGPGRVTTSYRLALPATTRLDQRSGVGANGRHSTDDLRQAAHQFEIVAATDPELRQCQLRPVPGPGGARRPGRSGRRPRAHPGHLQLARGRPDRPVRLCGAPTSAGRPPELERSGAASRLLDHLAAEPAVRLALSARPAAPDTRAAPGQAGRPTPSASISGAPLAEGDTRACARADLPFVGQAGPHRRGALRAGRPGQRLPTPDPHVSEGPELTIDACPACRVRRLRG